MIITHLDSDGILSLALYLKVKEEKRIYFSFPAKLKDTIALSFVGRNEFKELTVLDIAPNQIAIKLASIYDKVLWLDHHEKREIEVPENVNLIVKNYPSCASLVNEYFNLNEEKIVEIANQIDTNNVKDDYAKDFRIYVSAIRYKFSNFLLYSKLKLLAKKIANDNFDFIYNEIDKATVEEYKEFVKKSLNLLNYEEIEGKYKIIVIDGIKGLPTYEIYEKFKDKGDLILVFYKNRLGYKIEFRSEKVDCNKLASLFSGGGHKKASGALCKEKGEAINKIIKFLEEQNSKQKEI